MIVCSDLSSQGSAHGCSQKVEFGAALKQKAQLRDRYVSADANLSERLPEILKQ